MFEHSLSSLLSPPFRSIPAELCHKIHHSGSTYKNWGSRFLFVVSHHAP